MSKQAVGSGEVQGRPDEWIGALVTLPSYVTDDERPYRPTAVMWIETDSGLVVDTELVRPEQALARAAGLFQLATREPKSGEPRVPRRLRVSDEALASALRESVGDVELVVAPTPEMDEVVASMNEYMSRRASGDIDGDDGDDDGLGDDDEDDADGQGWTYLGPGTAPDDVAAMFAAAARLFKAAPWDLIPADVSLAVSCDVLGIEAGAMVVVGQAGQSHGFSLFTTVEHAMRFYDAVEAHERGERVPLPPHMMFSFDDRGEIEERLLEEIERHGWTVASEKAYPLPLMVDPDLVTRGLTRVELAGVTAIMTALAALVESEPQELATAWDDDETGIAWNQTVTTPTGDVNVELGAPLDLPGEHGHAHDHQAMAGVENFLDDEGEIDPEIIEDYIHALMHELEQVPDIEEMHLRAAKMLILEGARSFGLPITTAPSLALRDLLFRVMPAKHDVVAELAAPFVDAAQLLMAYADEALGIETAAQSRVMLSQPDFVDDLAKAWGSAKTTSKKKPATKSAAAKKPATKNAAAKKPAAMKPAAMKAKAKATAKAKAKAKAPAKKPAKKTATKTKAKRR